MHARRRRQALHTLRTSLGPGTVVFICHGNICRSPFAEGIFRKRLGSVGIFLIRAIRSAGFVGPDRSSPPAALESAMKFGVDMTAHRSALINNELAREANLLVTMSAEQARDLRKRFPSSNALILVLGDLDPFPIETRTIRDPWRCPPEVFDASYARIDRCVQELVAAIRERGVMERTI
jgi:Protein-tyrosine-phosphatase